MSISTFDENTEQYLIKVSGACLRIAGRQVLEDIDLEVARGETLTLIGPNGSGKTSLVRLLLGLYKPDQGSVHCRPGLRVGYMPQKLIVDNALPLTVEGFLKLVDGIEFEYLLKVVDQLGIKSLLSRPIQNISGGEFQHVLLARALLRKPELLVLDEPAQGVDINGQQKLYQLIASIRNEFGCGIIMVSHDLNLVMESTDRVLCLNTHICCTGHPEAVTQHPEYLKLFGGTMEGFAVYTHNHDHSHDLHGDVISHEDHDHG
ncbi:MAG: ATP-binding cassette domain-containing protein [Gammaproteobacteria bacterium]|nr:ATP-binding cassette domain-containing protein [Gammaproteobacteria bacterium]